jgi:hypothetical protein
MGGVKKLYQQVDALCSAGIDAAIVESRLGERQTWFENQTPVVAPPIEILPGDLLAIPEAYGDRLPEIAPGVPKVSINQNAYHTFNWLEIGTAHPYSTCEDLLGVMVISEDNRRFVSHCFPDLSVTRVHYGFDSDIFYFDSTRERQRRLAFMPRKREGDSHKVLSILNARGVLGNWLPFPIDNMNELEVAEALRESLVFLSFSQQEGCPMPPTEALACGCFVIGFSGFGGDEYFLPEHSARVEDGNVLEFARAVERFVESYDRDNRVWDEALSRAASKFVMSTYSREHERSELIDFFDDALLRAARSQTTTTLTRRDVLLARPVPLRARVERHLRAAKKKFG